jgi:hypothetical protein
VTAHCIDLARALFFINITSTHSGHGRVVVDPLVRLAYDARTDLDLHARHDL